MKALVTGVTGFVGSHLAQWLLRNDVRVLGMAHHPWHADAPRELVNGINLLTWDIRRPAESKLRDWVAEFAPEVVFHFAGLSIPSKCGTTVPSPRARAVNIQGTSNVLELVEHLPVQPRLVFASTCHVYDRVTAGDPFVTEQYPLRPRSAYGQTKIQCERIIVHKASQSNLETCIVRGFHHIGPRQPSGLMLTDWLAQIGPDCSELKVRSTRSFLDLVDVRDAAKAYYLLAKSSTCIPVCNLGSGRVSCSGDVLQAMLRRLDRNLRVTSTSVEEQWNPIADISLLRSLGWQAEISYEQTISDMMSGHTAT